MLIKLKHCSLHYEKNAMIETHFHNGASWGAFPHHNDHYYEIARRLGYGDDLWWYAFEHEFAHSFCSEWIANKPSYVISSLASGHTPEPLYAAQEESLVHMFQRFLRNN